MLRRRKLRRAAGVLLVIVGGALMWLAPVSAFVPLSTVGIVLLIAGIMLEVAGIALEHREANRQGRGKR